MIAACKSCGNKPHEQNKLHGPGNRVFNQTEKKDGNQQTARCTVCGAEYYVNDLKVNPK